MKEQARVDASQLEAVFGTMAPEMASRRVADAVIDNELEEAARWRHARRFLLKHMVIEQHRDG